MRRSEALALAAAAAFWSGTATGAALIGSAAVLLAVGAALALVLASRGLAPVTTSLLAILLCGASAANSMTGRDLRIVPAGWIAGELRSVEATRLGPKLTIAGVREPIFVRLRGDPRLDALPDEAVPGARLRLFTGAAGRSLQTPAAATIEVIENAPLLVSPALLAARARLWFASRTRERLDASPRDAAALAIAMTSGDRSRLDDETKRVLRESGIYHLAVVSGLQVAMIALVAGRFATPGLGSRHPWRRCGEALAALTILIFLPTDSPVLRASTSLGLARLAGALGRGVPPSSALSAATLLLLVGDPTLATEVSFVLTILATCALTLALASPEPLRWLRAALAPWLATWPVIVWLWDRAAPWGPVATWTAGPFLTVSLFSSWVAVLWPREDLVSRFAENLATEMSAIGLRLAGDIALWKGSGLLASPTSLAWGVALLVALGVSLVGRKRWRRRAAIVVALVWIWSVRPVSPAQLLALDIVDVGQGQALLIRDGSHAALVDAGDDRPADGSRALLAHLRAERIAELDALVITHWDRDHSGGARDIVSACPPRRLIVTAAVLDDPQARDTLGAAAKRGIPIHPIASGDAFTIGRFEVFAWAPEPGSRDAGNGGSIVLSVAASARSAWLPGDSGVREERRLLERYDLPRVDLLVPGHHGARESTSAEVLAQLDPGLAVASCGRDNSYGHPHPQTVMRLQRQGAIVLTTASAGTLRWIPRTSGALIEPVGSPAAQSSRQNLLQRVWHEDENEERERKDRERRSQGAE